MRNDVEDHLARAALGAGTGLAISAFGITAFDIYTRGELEPSILMWFFLANIVAMPIMRAGSETVARNWIDQ